MPVSSKWSPSLRFSHQNPSINLSSPLHHTCYMPHPIHSSQIDHLKNLCWGVQIIKLTITYYCSNLQSTSYITP
jgi:hypothetical protein